ncbi:MAG: hypothetical protein KF830_00415 [Planctomycetes bacterium]|nr:hypothetical protein [Planctomycetota bacterium]
MPPRTTAAAATAWAPPARWWLFAALPALAVAAVQAAWPWPFVSDDAFVSLRYAERLLHGHGLTWTDGERVEGYSNLAWVLASAALGALGLDLVAAARLLGAACTAGALLLLARAQRPHDARTACLAALAPLLVATSQPVLAWTLGGLEGPMLLLWLAWGFGALGRAPDLAAAGPRALLGPGVPFALACWTRPDSPLWVAGIALGLGLAARGGGFGLALRRAAAFAALPAAAVLLQLACRLAYYGDTVPNTAHVKAEFDPGHGGAGVDYVLGAWTALPGLAWPALGGGLVLLAARRTRLLGAVLLVPLALWAAYLMAIGGDHFPGRRLLHGALAPLGLLAAAGLRAVAGTAWSRTLLAVLLGGGAALWGALVARSDAQSHELRAEVWEWRGKAVGEALATAFADARPLLAVDAAGAVPFYSRLPALDLLGLCDRTIATTPYRDWLHQVKARGDVPLPPGHLRGNGAYAMARAPDLMLFGPPPGLPVPVFVSALEFEDDPRFLDGYRCVHFAAGTAPIPPGSDRVEAIVAPLWVHVRGRFGPVAAPDRIEIPALWFGSLRYPGPLLRRRLPPPPDDPAAAAIADGLRTVGAWHAARAATVVPQASGGVELELHQGGAAFAWPVPRGTWRLATVPAAAGVQVRVAGEAPAAGGLVTFDRDQEVPLELTVAPGTPRPARLQGVVLQRAGP